MGKRGPKPQSSNVTRLRGNPGHRRLREEVVLPPATLTEPDWRGWIPALRGQRREPNARMRATARDEWRRVAPALDRAGVLSVVDQAALESHCVFVAHLWECERQLSIEGLMIVDRDGVERRNPLSIVCHQLRGAVARSQQAFGLTPADRRGLPSPPSGGGGDDDAGAVFRWDGA